MNDEVNSIESGEAALEAVKDKEQALRALISIGNELQNQSGALDLVNSVVSGEKIPIAQKAFIAAQEMTKTFSLDELAKFYKGLEVKSSKCLKIICLRTDLLDESEIKGSIPKNSDHISLIKITKAFRKGAASTQAIEKLISKRNPHAKVAKTKELDIPLEKVIKKLKDLKKEESEIRRQAVGSANSIQDDLKKIMNDPSVSEKVRKTARSMQIQVQDIEEQLKNADADLSKTMIYVEEVTLGGEDFDETGASENDEKENAVIVDPEPSPPPKPSPKPKPDPEPEAPSQPEITPEPVIEPKPVKNKWFFSRFISWLMSDFTAPSWLSKDKDDSDD